MQFVVRRVRTLFVRTVFSSYAKSGECQERTHPTDYLDFVLRWARALRKHACEIEAEDVEES